MFVVSVNSKKVKTFLLPALVTVIAVIIAITFFSKTTEPAVNDSGAFNYRASSSAERLHFISQFGWAVDEEPVEVREIVIPQEFDDVYENYNKIQTQQGFDLSDFHGKRVKRWTYIITNYPGYSDDEECVRINLLVFDGLVIGGDVCSVELDGFMHGFSSPFKNS